VFPAASRSPSSSQQAKQPCPRQPSFGWQAAGHTAIREGAAGAINHPGWRDFVTLNQSPIGYYDTAQDSQHKGPWHFANLELANNATKPLRLTWAELMEQWSPHRLAAVGADWQTQLLTEQDLPKGTTVYDSVLESFNSVLRALSTEYEPHATDNRQTVNDATFASLGALNHYVADLHMPLHTTAAFDWPLLPTWGGKQSVVTTNMHEFIEGELFTADELTNMALHAQQQPIPKLTLNTLKPYLLGQIMQSYLTNFQIFQAQVGVMSRMVNPAAQPENYKLALKAVLKPIIAERLMTAQRSMTAIHNLLWAEAQRLEANRTS
jgi:hypothetical protein